ncbi:8342_t:CDS:2, partial [Gigaspora margarita]
MSAIITKIVEKYNLSPEMSVTDLSQYISEFLENLTNDRKRIQARRLEGSCRIVVTKPPKSSEEEIIIEITKRILQNRYGFSEGQVDDLFSVQKNVQPKSKTTHKVPCSTVNIVISKKQSLLSSKDQVPQETIGEMAHWLLRDKLSIRDIRAKAYALALLAKNANAGSSRLSRLRRELRNLGALPTIVEATKFPDFTKEANKIQRDNQKKAEANRIDYSDHFTLESVKERLDSYDTSTVPDIQALADVIIMLCIRPTELITLRITNARVTGRMGNPGKPEVKWFNRFLKEYDLIPKYLQKMGAVYSVVTHEAKNIAHAYTIAGEYLRHSSDNHTSNTKLRCNRLSEYGVNYIVNNIKTSEAWLRFAKYYPPKYVCKRLLKLRYEINSKNHWKNFIFCIKNNLTSYKQIDNDPKYRDFKDQLAYFRTLYIKNRSATIIQQAVIKWLYRDDGPFMKDAQDR